VYSAKAGQIFCEKTSGKTVTAGFQGVHRRNSLSYNTRASPSVGDGAITTAFEPVRKQIGDLLVDAKPQD
jgi:hypothetical protein